MRSPIRLHTWVDKMKHPAYTGENRCMPCTLLNLGIAVLFGAVAAVVAGSIFTESPTVPVGLGVVILSFGIATIFFRGYLIPGTPTFTKRYFPDWLLTIFDKQEMQAQPTEIVPEAILGEIGVVVDDPIAEDFGLNPEFAREWQQSVEAHSENESLVAESISQLSGAPSEQISFENRPRTYMAWVGDEHLASWPSRAASIADAAGATVLPAYDPEWDIRPLPVKAEILGVLRLFLDRCPTCDGGISLSQGVVESCCQSRDVVAATCDECNARVFETDIDPAALAEK